MFRKLVFSSIATLLLIVPAFGQDKFVLPNQKVVGAEEAVPANEIVVLKVTPIKEQPKYLQSVTYSWTILADSSKTPGTYKEKQNIFVYPDNTTVGFGRGDANKIQALLVINYLYAVKDDKGVITEVGQKSSGIIFTDVKFQGVNPTPPPGPDPVPPPDNVDLPVGKFDLAKPAYNLAIQKVPATNRAKGAQAISTAIEGVVSSIRAGALKEPTDILKKLKAANNTALQNAGVPVNEWDAWGSAFQDKLFQLYKDKKLNTANDYADAFTEVVTGLSKVK